MIFEYKFLYIGAAAERERVITVIMYREITAANGL